MEDKERFQLEYDCQYAQYNADRVLAGVFLVAIVGGFVFGFLNILWNACFH